MIFEVKTSLVLLFKNKIVCTVSYKKCSPTKIGSDYHESDGQLLIIIQGFECLLIAIGTSASHAPTDVIITDF